MLEQQVVASFGDVNGIVGAPQSVKTLEMDAAVVRGPPCFHGRHKETVLVSVVFQIVLDFVFLGRPP